MLTELREAAPGGLADEPNALVDQLVDGLREQFELVDRAHPAVNPDEGRASLAVSGSAYGDVTRFDNPVASLVAVGLAVGLDERVALTVDRTPGGRAEYLVTVRWAVEAAEASEPGPAEESNPSNSD